MSKLKESYAVGEISVDADGRFWLSYIGEHPEQGGMGYGWGSIQLHSPKELGEFVEIVFTKELPKYIEQINKKEQKSTT